MNAQIFFVTSVRGITFAPQIAARSELSVFGAKIPTPFFFIAKAFRFPAAFFAVLPLAFFSAVILRRMLFGVLGFLVFTTVLAFVVFFALVTTFVVLAVMAKEGKKL